MRRFVGGVGAIHSLSGTAGSLRRPPPSLPGGARHRFLADRYSRGSSRFRCHRPSARPDRLLARRKFRFFPRVRRNALDRTSTVPLARGLMAAVRAIGDREHPQADFDRARQPDAGVNSAFVSLRTSTFGPANPCPKRRSPSRPSRFSPIAEKSERAARSYGCAACHHSPPAQPHPSCPQFSPLPPPIEVPGRRPAYVVLPPTPKPPAGADAPTPLHRKPASKKSSSRFSPACSNTGRGGWRRLHASHGERALASDWRCIAAPCGLSAAVCGFPWF